MEKPKKRKDGNKNKFYTHFRLKYDVARNSPVQRRNDERNYWHHLRNM